MKKLLMILMLCISFALSATNTLKYNGKTETWTGKWQMSDSYEYKVKNEAWSGEITGYYVTKHNCKVTITVFAEDNLSTDNNYETNFKMTFDDCPYMVSATVSAYDGKTWIGEFIRDKKVKETSYTNQITQYFGINMLKNITKLKFYPEVNDKNQVYETLGLHCNDGYEPSKENWEKDYVCLNSDSIAKVTCESKKNMIWIDNECEKIKECKASEVYIADNNTCQNKQLPYANVHWLDSTYTTVECNDGFIKSDDETEWYCTRICNENEHLLTETNECLPNPNCDLHQVIKTGDYGYYCETVYKPKLTEWNNDTTNNYHCVENSTEIFGKDCVCNDGYYELNNKCVKEPKCGSHQYLSNHICYNHTKPDNSHWFSEDKWICDDGYFQLDEKCYSNCADDEYFENNWHECRTMPKKAIKINTYTYTCPEGTHEEYNECVSDPIDWSFIKNENHLYFDLDIGGNSCFSKYYDTESCFGTSMLLGYNFVIGVLDNNFQVGINLNTNAMFNMWNKVSSQSYNDKATEFYNALTIGGGLYFKVFNIISYTGYIMLPLFDNNFDDTINITSMIGNKFAIDGKHNSIYFKYIYGSKYFNYKGIGWSYRY